MLDFQADLQSMMEAKKRERADSILEMTSIFKKVDELASFKVEVQMSVFSLSTMVACLVEKEALNMAFEVEREKKVKDLLQEIK